MVKLVVENRRIKTAELSTERRPRSMNSPGSSPCWTLLVLGTVEDQSYLTSRLQLSHLQLLRVILCCRWVVTAAHCVYGYETDDAWVRVGDHDNSDQGDTDYDNIQTIKVKKVLVHRMYNHETTVNDIALLRLERRLDFSKYGGTVSPICLPTEASTYYGEKV